MKDETIKVLAHYTLARNLKTLYQYLWQREVDRFHLTALQYHVSS